MALHANFSLEVFRLFVKEKGYFLGEVFFTGAAVFFASGAFFSFVRDSFESADLSRAALFGWMIPFFAALSMLLTVSLIASTEGATLVSLSNSL